MTVNDFMDLCMDGLNLMFTCLSMIVDYWYFALLFAAGLIALGFDIIGELSDFNNNNSI